MNNWTGFARTAIAAAVAVVAVAPALAQNTTSAISGRIVGPDGKGVAGASVSVVHVESGSTSNVVTDAEGRFAARGLRAGGPFTITITKGGQTERREGVFLALAETLNFDATLGAPAQSITVTGRRGSDTFSRTAMGAGSAIGSREIAAMPSISGSLQDLARGDPRLAQTDKERGEISAFGQNTRYNSITIDGVTTNDTFGLESNNLPMLRQPVSIDAIQSVQVNLSNYDVTQKGYTGANINAVTKSGTNEFKGNVHYSFRNSDWVGQRFNRTSQTYFPAPNFREFSTGLTLGGPIVKDKLFFFAAYDKFTSTRASPTFGPLGSPLTNVGITQDAINQAISTAKTTWGMDVGGSDIPGGLKLEVKDLLLKLDWNINDDHRASVRYTKTKQNEPQLNGFSTTGLSLSSWWFDQAKTLESVVGQWFADWTPNLSTELKVGKRDYDSVPTPFNGLRQPAIGLRFSGALPAGSPAGVSANNRFLNFGTENSRHFNILRTKTTDLYAGANWNLGAHELKFGADYSKNEVYNAFLQNVFGNYTFGCEPGTYSFGTISDCNAATVTSAQRDLATLENFRRGLPSSYTLQTANTGRTLNDAVAVWSYENTGLFLQDTFKVSPALNLMFGFRVDQQKVPSKPIFNTAAAAPRVAGSVTGTGSTATIAARDTGGFGMDNSVTLDGANLLQPRFGFNWKLDTTERRLQVRGGVGLFQGAAANVWLSNPFSNTGAAVSTFNCSSFQACNGTNNSTASVQALFSPNPDAPGTPKGTPPAPNVDFLSPSLKQPSTWKLNLAVDTEARLPLLGLVEAKAEWVHLKTKDGIYYKHLNLGNPTNSSTNGLLGPDGRPMFWTPQTYNPACWSGQNFITTGSCTGGRARALSNVNWGNNILLAEHTGKGGGDSITLSLGQPAGPEGFSWTASYTRQTAKEVNPLTSSTSSSNWSNRNIFDPNEEVLQNSNYQTKDRVSLSMNWSKAFVASYRTTFGVFYEGRRGKPYSWTYINDMNGDLIGGNDLMYIPKGPGSGEVVFKGGATEEAQFWNIVDAYKGLSSAKGGVVGRNNNYAAWVNNIDLRVSQEVPGFISKHKGVIALDFFNFGNFLDKRWGRINEIGFPSNRSFVNYNGTDSQGRYVYSLGSLEDLVTRQVNGESQWAVQVTLKYEF